MHVSRAHAPKKHAAKQLKIYSISLSRLFFFISVVLETSCLRFLRKCTRKNKMSASVSKKAVKNLQAGNPRFMQVLLHLLIKRAAYITCNAMLLWVKATYMTNHSNLTVKLFFRREQIVIADKKEI